MKFYCDLCGIKFESKSGNTKYCPECRKGVKYKKPAADKKPKMRSKTKRQPTSMGIAEVCRLARENGLSYGQYVVRMEQISGIRR